MKYIFRFIYLIVALPIAYVLAIVFVFIIYPLWHLKKFPEPEPFEFGYDDIRTFLKEGFVDKYENMN